MRTGLTRSQRAKYNRWFPASYGRRHEDIYWILRRARERLEPVRIDYMPAVPHTMVATAPDGILHEENFNSHTVAATFAVRPGGTLRARADWYVALYPEWSRWPGYAPAALVHESIHLADPVRVTQDHAGFYNAFRFHGFVCVLGDLGFRIHDVHGRAMA